MRPFAFAAYAVLASAFFFFGCGGGASRPPTPRRSEEIRTAARGGVDRRALDPKASPCEDFYQYACGGWIAATEIPGDESSWYRSFSVIQERNEEILRKVLQGLARGEALEATAYGKVLGDYYASCMDEEAIEKNGTAPLASLLAEIDAVEDTPSLTKVLGRVQARVGAGVPFSLFGGQDFGDAARVVGMIWQSGIGMPEKEYYLDPAPKMAEMRAKYEAHVAAMMKLAGDAGPKAEAAAKRVMAVETALARAWMSIEDRREPRKLHHTATRAELPKLAPGIDWSTWLEGASAKDVAIFNVGMPDYMKSVGAMLSGTVTIADWRTYLRWHVLRLSAAQLPNAFVAEAFRWTQALTGAKENPPRWKRCVRAVDEGMGEALGRPFVERTLGEEGKAEVLTMVRAIEAAMHVRLEKLVWMDDATRRAALEKLAKITNKIAYPDEWRSYEGIGIDRGPYVVQAQRASAFEYRRRLGKIGKPVDRGEWQMSPPSVNAYYEAQLNEIVFPAGILQPPFYSTVASRAANYGAIGLVMGHELTHGFDDEGRQFDAEGNLRDWWGKSVVGEFDRRAACVKRQFDDYTVLGDLHVNGHLTLGENIADLGGLKLAFLAMKETERARRSDREPGYSSEQEFFLGYAQAWCCRMRDEELRHLVATNSHAPPHLRVNGPLSNLPEFAEAFSCKAGSRMVRKDRCEVW
jgi:endothelin-converting enzyme/putative endopeptidase